MQRAGGYAAYWSAYSRLRREASRPLDQVDVTRLTPGVHRVHVVETETGGVHGWVELTLEASAGRRVTWRMRRRECQWVLGDELRVRIAEVGAAELRVCMDGTLLLVDPDGGVHDVDSISDAAQLCAHWDVQIKQPQVVGLA